MGQGWDVVQGGDVSELKLRRKKGGFEWGGKGERKRVEGKRERGKGVM